MRKTITLIDAEHELYPNCKIFTEFSYIIRLFQLSVTNGQSELLVMLHIIKGDVAGT